MDVARQKKEPLNCRKCEARCPDLNPENIPVWILWQAAATQWRTGPCGAIGLDYLAAFKVAKIIGVEMHPANLGRLQALERAELARARKKREEATSESEPQDPSRH